jgi:hypothetical protein
MMQSIGTIVLGFVALVELGVIAYILQINAAERSKLLDRIQAPEAPRMAAIADAFPDPGREFPSADDVVPTIPDSAWDDDLQLINAQEYAS